jgi:hypothetical protein
MPLYMIERNFAEEHLVNKDHTDNVKVVNDEEGIRWLYSFISGDKKKTYCLYEAPNPEAILAAARRLGVPADVIIAVDEVRPEASV